MTTEKTRTIHIRPMGIKAYTEGRNFMIEIEGRRNPKTWNGQVYKIVIHGYWYFPHYLIKQVYAAIKDHVSCVLKWRNDFKGDWGIK